MGISAVSSTTLSTFGQLNKEVQAIMDKAMSYMRVSNFGTETKLGSSKFQQQIKAISEQGAENMAKGMKAALDVTRVSNFGTETSLGHSKFQQANEQIISNYKTWQNGKTLGSRMDISA